VYVLKHVRTVTYLKGVDYENEQKISDDCNGNGFGWSVSGCQWMQEVKLLSPSQEY
jgi:hypothetical protein